MAARKGKMNGKVENVFTANAKRVSLDSLNRKISDTMHSALDEVVGTSVDSEVDEVLDMYEKHMISGKQLKMVFDASDSEGNFTAYDGDVLVVLSGESVLKAQGEVDVYVTSHMLGVELPISVVRVEREKRRVFCKVPSSVVWQGRNAAKAALNREIKEQLNAGKKPLVWGRIKDVKVRRAFVDILDQGILGVVDVSHWKKSFTRSLLGMCKEGEYYQFEIEKQAPKIEGKDTAWLLSRKNITEDPWKTIDFDNLKEGGNIIVECVEKAPGKSYWWGRSDRVPGIEVMGDYTVRFDRDGLMLESIRYMCKIKKIKLVENSKECEFKVVPYGVFPGDVAKVDAVKKLRNIRQ